MTRTLIFILLFVIPFYGRAKLPGTAVNNVKPKSSLLFIENKGQVVDQHNNPRKDIQFKLNAPGIDIFIGDGQIHYQWTKAIADSTQSINSEEYFLKPFDKEVLSVEQKFETYRMDVVLLNANPNSEVIKEEPGTYYENYYLPQCPDGLTAHCFRKIIYKNIYPKIDWVIYTNGKALKYDFVVHPGGNPKDIQLQYNGANSLSLADEALTAVTPFGSITENSPYSYEADTKKEIPSTFRLNENTLGFDIAPSQKKIIIDPQLEWATYYGGNSSESGFSIGNVSTSPGNLWVDANGSVACGSTNSPNNIATGGSFQVTFSGSADGWVASWSGTGSLLWATYFGGTGRDGLTSIISDGNNIYVGGVVCSKGLSTAGANDEFLDTSMGFRPHDPDDYYFDGILAKFTRQGLRQWVTYYGGEYDDGIEDITLDISSGYLFMVGGTQSKTGVATPGSLFPVNSDDWVGFVSSYDTTGMLRWSTYYYGGVQCLVANKVGGIYIAGTTESITNIATPGCYQSTCRKREGFIAKFDTFGNRIWGTYYGGEGHDLIWDITSDVEDNIYVVGSSSSDSGIATPGVFKEHITVIAQFDAVVAKFDSSGQRLWGSYFGGSVYDGFTSIALDKRNDLAIVGGTYSKDKVATPGAWSRNLVNLDDAMFVKFDDKGNRLWATYYGGELSDAFYGVSADSLDNLYIGGFTFSKTKISTPLSHQPTHGGFSDFFLVKALPDSLIFFELDSVICLSGADSVFYLDYYTSRSFYQGNVFAVQLSDSAGDFTSPIILGSVPATGTGTIKCIIPKSVVLTKGYRIRITASAPAYISNDNGVDIEIRTGPEKPVATKDTSLCAGTILQLSATCPTPGVSFTWLGPNNFTANTANTTRENMAVADSGDYIVTVSPPECKMRDTVHVSVLRSPDEPTITHNAPVCEGDTLVFSFQQDTDSNTFYTISWPDPHVIFEPNGIMDSASRNFTGEYIVVANLKGCISRDTSYVYVKPAPILTFNTNSPVYAGKDLELSVSADSADSYIWEGPDGFSSVLQDNIIRDVTSYNGGLYTVTSSYNGCTSVGSTIVVILDSDEDILVLFPNPNDGTFTIRGNLKADQQIQMLVTNAAGQKIYSDKVKTAKKKFNHTVILPAVASGKYFLSLRVGGKARIIPFAVK